MYENAFSSPSLVTNIKTICQSTQAATLLPIDAKMHLFSELQAHMPTARTLTQVISTSEVFFLKHLTNY